MTPVYQADDIITFATLSEGTKATFMFFANKTRMAPSPTPSVKPFTPIKLFAQPQTGSLYVLTTESKISKFICN